MGRPAFALEKLSVLPENLEAPVWTGLPTFHVSRERFRRIGRNPTDPAPNFRAQAFNRLGYLYGVDKLGIRDKILTEFGYKRNDADIMIPSETITELGITDDPATGLKFGRDPHAGSDYCPPAHLDMLDAESMCNFTSDVMELIRRGRDYQEQRDLLTWKAGKRTGPSMIEHWARAGHVLIAAATNVPEVDN